MASLGFAANVFDGICAYYSIIHVPTKEHRTVFEEFARVLRSDGALLITVGDDAWEGSNPDWLESGVKMQWSFPELERTRQYLSDAGFEVVNQWTAEDNLGGGDDNDDGGFPFLLVRLT